MASARKNFSKWRCFLISYKWKLRKEDIIILMEQSRWLRRLICIGHSLIPSWHKKKFVSLTLYFIKNLITPSLSGKFSVLDTTIYFTVTQEFKKETTEYILWEQGYTKHYSYNLHFMQHYNKFLNLHTTRLQYLLSIGFAS